MRATGVVLTALALRPVALADRQRNWGCNNNKKPPTETLHDIEAQICFWYSEKTSFCGSTDYHLYQIVDRYKFIAWTKDLNHKPFLIQALYPGNTSSIMALAVGLHRKSYGARFLV